MSLVLALKNRDSIVVASDTDHASDGTLKYGQFLNLPGRAILLMAGNIEAVRRPIVEKVIPKLNATTSAATLAQLLQAALVLDVVPHLSEIPGRVELIVAGIDPVRHIEEPGIYYLDSARDFYLTVIQEDFAAAGATAVVTAVLNGRNLASATTDELSNVAKECLAATKMRWPEAVGTHQRLGIITLHQTRILDF
jgi:20S proteasome alpha/beta subunit